MQVLKEGVAPSLHRRSKQQTETGRVVNIMSADVNNIIQFFYPMMAQLVVAPCILIAALVLLWFQIRWVLPPLHCSQGSCFVCCCCLIAGFSYCIVCILRADAKPEPLRRLHSFLSKASQLCPMARCGVAAEQVGDLHRAGHAGAVFPGNGFFCEAADGPAAAHAAGDRLPNQAHEPAADGHPSAQAVRMGGSSGGCSAHPCPPVQLACCANQHVHQHVTQSDC